MSSAALTKLLTGLAMQAVKKAAPQAKRSMPIPQEEGLSSLKNIDKDLPKHKKGLSSVNIDEKLYEDVLKREDGKPIIVYRGSRIHEETPKKDVKDILKGKSRKGYATFLSDNPYMSQTYMDTDIVTGENTGVLTPYLVKPKKIIEYEEKNKYLRDSGKFDFFEFDRQAQNLKEGEVLVNRNVVDAGPTYIKKPGIDPEDDPFYSSYRSDIYAIKDSNTLVSPFQESFSKPLGIGVDEKLVDGKLLKNYNEQDFNILEDLVNQGKASAGTKAANKLINAPIDQGKEVGIRLNLNSKINDAPENVKPMLQTIHNKNARGSALSYQPFATVVKTKDKKVQFYVSPKGREQIAKGEKSKFPAMSVNGAYEPNLKILPTDDDVVEIGFNPKAHHLFIDLETGQAVKEADAATVIGDRVYAKNVTYFRKSKAPEPEAESQVRYKYKKKGGSVVQRNPNPYEAKAI